MFNATAFFSYVFLTAFTPGPNNFMAMSNASRYGFKGGFRFCLGVLGGFAVVMTMCAVFSSLLFNLIPKIEPYMRAVGACYLGYLAWAVYRDKGASGGESAGAGSFFTGMAMQFVNVKVILYGITAISTFVLPYDGSFGSLALFVAILSLVGFAGTCCWALFGAAFQKIFTTHRRSLNAVMALLLLYCTVSIFY